MDGIKPFMVCVFDKIIFNIQDRCAKIFSYHRCCGCGVSPKFHVKNILLLIVLFLIDLFLVIKI